MLAPALQRFGIALILVGGIDQLSKAAAWQTVDPNVLVIIGLALAVLGFLRTFTSALRDFVAADGSEDARPEPNSQ